MTDFSLVHRTHPATSGEAPHPGLIMMHGLGSHEMDMLSLAEWLDPRLYVVSVRAPFPYGPGFMWYDLYQHGPGLGGPGIEESLDRLERFLAEALAGYPLDRNRLYAGGFSQGAAMAAALALLHPDRVAGAVMASGFLPPPDGRGYRLEEIAGHPFFQAHGTYDQTVPIEYAHMTRSFLQRTPVDLTYREYPIGHEVSMEELQDMRAWLEGVLEAGSP